MAYVNSTRTASFGLSDRIAATVASVKLALQRRAIFQRTLHEIGRAHV